MKLYNFFYILFLFLIKLNNTQTNQTGEFPSESTEETDEEFLSSCETAEGVSSYEDCKQKSTEYIFEVRCFMKGKQHGEESLECVDVTRDDIRKEKDLNLTINKIKNGTYWDNYKDTYDYIEMLKCFSNYIFPKILIFLFCLLLK